MRQHIFARCSSPESTCAPATRKLWLGALSEEALGLSKFGGWECARGTKRETGNCCFPAPVRLAVLKSGANFARPLTSKKSGCPVEPRFLAFHCTRFLFGLVTLRVESSLISRCGFGACVSTQFRRHFWGTQVFSGTRRRRRGSTLNGLPPATILTDWTESSRAPM